MVFGPTQLAVECSTIEMWWPFGMPPKSMKAKSTIAFCRPARPMARSAVDSRDRQVDDADRMIVDPDQRGVVFGGAQHDGAGIGAIPADLHEAVVVDVDFGIEVDAVGELDVALPDERFPAGAKGALRRAWPPGRALGIVNAVRRGMKLDGLWSGGRRRTHARQRHDEGAYQRCFDHHVTRWSGSAAWPQVAQYLGSTPIRAVMGFRQGSQQPALHLT